MPTPDTIRTTRLSLGLTQQQAGELVGASTRTWRSWEAGFRVMPGSKWELWEIKTKGAVMEKRIYKCELVNDGVIVEMFFRSGTSAKDVLDDLEMFKWPKGTWRITSGDES